MNSGQAELLARLYRACPGFAPRPEDAELAYIQIGDFVRHVIAAHVAGRRHEVQATFDVIEAELVAEAKTRGKTPAGELAVIGFLEDMQNGNLHVQGTAPPDFRVYLGPQSLKSWEALNGFWGMVEHGKGLTS